jgi:hypothetical protein
MLEIYAVLHVNYSWQSFKEGIEVSLIRLFKDELLTI